MRLPVASCRLEYQAPQIALLSIGNGQLAIGNLVNPSPWSILPHGMKRLLGLLGCIAVLAAVTGGCVERILTVQTNPPGALVQLNGQEMGRTPFSRDFTWYGIYEITVRRDEYQTIHTSAWVIAPIYEWIPLDLISELLPIPLKDRHTLSYNLTPAPPASGPSPGILMRAAELKGQLEPSHYPPATRKAK
jgi:PEGA domain-containing protein